jgi:hypothetical protein
MFEKKENRPRMKSRESSCKKENYQRAHTVNKNAK